MLIKYKRKKTRIEDVPAQWLLDNYTTLDDYYRPNNPFSVIDYVNLNRKTIERRAKREAIVVIENPVQEVVVPDKYTDDTVIDWGKYRGMRLGDIPAQWLLSVYKCKSAKKEGDLLYAYIEQRDDDLRDKITDFVLAKNSPVEIVHQIVEVASSDQTEEIEALKKKLQETEYALFQLRKKKADPNIEKIKKQLRVEFEATYITKLEAGIKKEIKALMPELEDKAHKKLKIEIKKIQLTDLTHLITSKLYQGVPRLYCQYADKYIFISVKEVVNELQRISDLEQTFSKPVDHYVCRVCGGIHMTSKDSSTYTPMMLHNAIKHRERYNTDPYIGEIDDAVSDSE